MRYIGDHIVPNVTNASSCYGAFFFFFSTKNPLSFVGDVQDRNWGNGRSARQIIINGSIQQSNQSIDLSNMVEEDHPINVTDLQDIGAGQEVT